MDPKCDKLIEKITSSYDLSDDFQDFLDYEIEDGDKFFHLEVFTKDKKEKIAYITLGISPHEKAINILAVVRDGRKKANKTHKGIGHTLVYLTVCKAIQLDYSLKFSATPYSESDDLFKYYNTLGFTRKGNIRGTGRNRGLQYETSPEELKQIIASKAGGRRKTNTTKTRKIRHYNSN